MVAMAALLHPRGTALRLLDSTEPLLSSMEARDTELLNILLTVNRAAMVDLLASNLRRLGASTLDSVTGTRQQRDTPKWKLVVHNNTMHEEDRGAGMGQWGLGLDRVQVGIICIRPL